MAIRLRNFLYLDGSLTDTFLSQLEGGLYEEEEQSNTERVDRSRGGTAKAGPVSGHLSRGSAGEQRVTRTMRQTPEAAFSRLEQLLEAAEAIQWLEALDDPIWRDLRRGEVVAVESLIEVPSLFRVIDVASEIGPLVDLMESFGEEIDAGTDEAITGLTQIGQVLRDIGVFARPAGTPRYKFVCPLKRGDLRDSLAALEGEAVIVGTIQRRLRPGERYSFLDGIGIGAMPREQRRRIERDLKKDRESADLVVAGPAAILSPIAIYR